MVYYKSNSKVEELIHENENKIVDKKNFLMCKSCFWCASFLTAKRNMMQCPSCGNNEMELMFISNYQSYKLDDDYVKDMVSHVVD